jgi:hypothetical protein
MRNQYKCKDLYMAEKGTQVLNLLRTCPDKSLNHPDGYCYNSVWQDCAHPDLRIGSSGCFTLKNR